MFINFACLDYSSVWKQAVAALVFILKLMTMQLFDWLKGVIVQDIFTDGYAVYALQL